MSRFDRLVLAAVLGLALAIAGLSVALARLGPSVDGIQTATTFDGTLVSTQIGVTFTEPMRLPSAERSFHLSPSTAGTFSWSGNQMLFIPNTSLRYGREYTVTIGPQAADTSGRLLGRPAVYRFTTQSQHLLYLGTSSGEQGRLIEASIDGKRQTLGADDGLMTDYSVSLDRSLAVYVKRGSPGERPDEIWLLNLSDGSTQLLFKRPDWSITQPHLSPDDRQVVFLANNVLLCRPYYGCYRDHSGPLVYFVDVHSLKVYPFRSQSDVPITNFIAFAPNGQIAYTDLGSALTLAFPNGTGVRHVPNLGNALEFWGFDQQGDKAAFVGQTPSSSGGDVLMYDRSGQYTDVSRGVYDSSTPSFSSSGDRVAYAAYRGERGIEPLYGINVYETQTKHTTRLTAERDWTDWAPAWSPDDSYIAFVRTQPAEAMYLGAGEVWVMRANGKDARPVGGVGTNVTWIG
jgi:Tol biopolymer transport system component